MEISQPKYKVIPATLQVEGIQLIWNLQPFGPALSGKLLRMNYGKVSRMATGPESVYPIHYAVKNQEAPFSGIILDRLRDYGIIGKTRLIWTKNGLWGIDAPEGRFNEKLSLEKLTGKDEKGVSFSKDRKIRFSPKIYEAKNRELKSHEALASHPGVIVGYDLAGANLVAEISASRQSGPYICIEGKDDPPLLVWAGLFSGGVGGRLFVDGGSYWGDVGDWCSFGVSRAPVGVSYVGIADARKKIRGASSRSGN